MRVTSNADDDSDATLSSPPHSPPPPAPPLLVREPSSNRRQITTVNEEDEYDQYFDQDDDVLLTYSEAFAGSDHRGQSSTEDTRDPNHATGQEPIQPIAAQQIRPATPQSRPAAPQSHPAAPQSRPTTASSATRSAPGRARELHVTNPDSSSARHSHATPGNPSDAALPGRLARALAIHQAIQEAQAQQGTHANVVRRGSVSGSSVRSGSNSSSSSASANARRLPSGPEVNTASTDVRRDHASPDSTSPSRDTAPTNPAPTTPPRNTTPNPGAQSAAQSAARRAARAEIVQRAILEARARPDDSPRNAQGSSTNSSAAQGPSGPSTFSVMSLPTHPDMSFSLTYNSGGGGGNGPVGVMSSNITATPPSSPSKGGLSSAYSSPMRGSPRKQTLGNSRIVPRGSSGNPRNFTRSRNNFYAVAHGWHRGIYLTWEEAEVQINGYENPVFQSFVNLQDAEDFLDSHP